MHKVAKGIYPVMITPYREDLSIDWQAVDSTVEFYIQQGCTGIFAVCLSSEMFQLSEDERVALSARVVKAAAGRVSVVASGHVSPDIDGQIRELKRIADTGVDAAVMISSLLAKPDEDDDVLIANMHRILDAVPDVPFGMYECPVPYKRLLTPRVLDAMLETGRFSFIKDTCCDAELIAQRVRHLGSQIGLFNANCATLLETLQSGADGFSGIMANFHPDLLVWLYDHYREQPEKARLLMATLSIMSGVERCCHPIGAKYHMNRVGVPMTLRSRTASDGRFTPLNQREIDDLITLEEAVRAWLKQ